MAAARIAGEAFAGGGGVAPDRFARVQTRAEEAAPRAQRIPDGTEPDRALSDARHLHRYARHLFLPWCRDGDVIVVACAEDTVTVGHAIADACGADAVVAVLPKQQVVNAIQYRFRRELAWGAQFALDRARPTFSARRVLSRGQAWFAAVVVAAMAVWAAAAPETMEALGFVALALLYGINIVLRAAFHVLGWSGKSVRRVDAAEIAQTPDTDWPIYSVLVPLYREANMMRQITSALRRIDYPRDRIDIKLICEEIDAETVAAVRALNLDDRFELLIVPDARLRTKPRACNYALPFVRGEFAVIFDAEDRPARDQLKKAVVAFRTEPDIACFQARLAYFNADHNWLSKFFAIEYSTWFGVMLPGLARAGIPIPLGGTSNHFRTHVLRAIGGWDAYNVTEDADIGLRLARAGHHAAPLDSVTLEEANFVLSNWVRQRSRWLKGHMQTLLVHARAPRTFVRAVGWWRYLACLAFMGGAVVSALISPLMWALALWWAAEGSGPAGPLYTALFIGSFVFGNVLLGALAASAPYRTGEANLAPWALLSSFYWLLISAGAYKGLCQLCTAKRSFWEKTEHGLEETTPVRRAWAPRLALAHGALALAVVLLTSWAAFANPWLKQTGSGEAVFTLRAMKSIDGFAAAPDSDGALDVHTEYGVTNAVTLVVDGEAKEDGSVSGSLLEYGEAGARVQLLRWDTGVVSFQGEAGAGALRDPDGQAFFGHLHGTGEARFLLGQDFDLWGNHSWIAIETGVRWRGGPPADEGILDLTLGFQPRDDLFFMLQSFGVDTVDDPRGGYRRFKSDKLQLSAAYEFVPHVWIQVGGIASVYGDDVGNAGGIVALWWRF